MTNGHMKTLQTPDKGEGTAPPSIGLEMGGERHEQQDLERECGA